MIENHRLGKADGLSGWFVLQWAIGDTCNLVGCLFSQQQTATETYTAVYFVLSDVLLGAQYLYYKIKARRQRRLKRMIRESFFSSARSEKDPEGDAAAAAGARTVRASSTSGRPTTWRPSKAVRYGSIPANEHRDTTTGGETGNGEGGGSFSPGSSSVTSSLSRPLSAAVAMLAVSVSVMTTTAAAVPRAGVAAVALGARVERQRRAMMMMTTETQEPRADAWVSTSLLMNAQNCVDQPPSNRYFVIAGQTLGYVSLFCYISSRIAQIGRNYKRKSVEGLSTTMFVFAMLANLTYGAAILLAGGGEDVVLARLQGRRRRARASIVAHCRHCAVCVRDYANDVRGCGRGGVEAQRLGRLARVRRALPGPLHL